MFVTQVFVEELCKHFYMRTSFTITSRVLEVEKWQYQFEIIKKFIFYCLILNNFYLIELKFIFYWL